MEEAVDAVLEAEMGPLYPCVLNYPNYDRNQLKPGPCWRALLLSDFGLQYSVRNLLPEFVEELLKHNRVALTRLERGDWETAEEEFLLSKAMLLSIAGGEHIEKQKYDSLLAWAMLPLAQLYQSRGGADKLFAALEVRREILDLVQLSEPDLVLLCDTYVCTAQYEWGVHESSVDARRDAVRRYAELMHCDDEAEAQLCILLGVDHECLGNFEASLRWFQEGNRMWNPLYFRDAGKYGPKYRCGLSFAAQSLMRLGKFLDAVQVLEASIPDILDPINSTTFDKLLLECYMQIMTKAAAEGDSRQANRYKEMAREKHGLQRCKRRPCMICCSEEDLKVDALTSGDMDHLVNILQYHPILTPTPSPLGNSLGLLPGAHDALGFNFYHDVVTKLPWAITAIIESQRSKRTDLELIVGVVKVSKRILDRKTYHHLLSYFAFPLAFQHQYNLSEFGLAAKIWLELIDSAKYGTEPDYMELATHGYNKMLYALQFEAMHGGKRPIHPSIISLNIFASPATTSQKDRLERESCFWLYFGHYRAGNWRLALKWVRMAKKLRNEQVASCSDFVCPSKHCAHLDDEVLDYFCCDYDYMLCEAELLMKLQEFEDAHQMLREVLLTEHVRRGGPVAATQAEVWTGVWMTECITKIYATSSKTAYTTECLIYLSAMKLLDIFKQRGEEIKRKSPPTPPTGCILVLDGEYRKLAQSQVGLELHLYKLPNPYRLAFRYHGSKGRVPSPSDGVGEDAIFEFEWCREVLTTLSRDYPKPSPDIKRAYEWLMVWATIPLADIYQFKKMQPDVAAQLRREAFQNIPEDEMRDSDEHYRHLTGQKGLGCNMMDALYTMFCSGLYQQSVSKYPDLKKLIVRAAGLRSGVDDWAAECVLLAFLAGVSDKFGSFEAALRFARLAKQHLVDLEQQKDRTRHEHDHLQELGKYVYLEFSSLAALGLHDEARKVLESYRDSNHLTDEELPSTIRYAFLQSINQNLKGGIPDSEDLEMYGIEAKLSEMRVEMALNAYSPDLVQLELDKLRFERTEEYAKGIEYFEKLYVELVGKDPVAKEFLVLNLFCFHWKLAFDKLMSGHSCSNIDEVKAFDQDINFKNAFKYLDKLHHLFSTLHPFQDPHFIGSTNLLMMLLYSKLDVRYCHSLVPFMDQIRNGMRHVIHGGPLPEPGSLMSISLAFKEIETFLNRKTSIVELGDIAVKQFASILDTMAVTKRYTEGWIELLEWHRLAYTYLQEYYAARARFYTMSMLKAPNFEARSKILTEDVDRCNYKAFVYAEIERAQVMIYQLRAYRLNQQWVSHAQWSFDRRWNVDARNYDDLAAAIWNNSTALLQGRSVFVLYSSMEPWRYRIYMLDQRGVLTVKQSNVEPTRDGRSFEELLKQLYSYLGEKDSRLQGCRGPKSKKKRKKKEYDADSANKDLEFLHDVLIGPIAEHLGMMKPEEKLILCPSQSLTKVPFAALRDRDGKYLIERHTIALTSSLRILHFCRERLKRLRSELQGPPPHTRRGSIVALGNPKYNVCANCSKTQNRRQELSGTGQEVENITKLFEKTVPVVELLEEQATAHNLLQWASKPSQDRSLQQAIVHIGAHGVVKMENHRENVLQLACPQRSSNGDNLLKLDVLDVASPSQRAGGSDVASTSQQKPGIRGAQLVDYELVSCDDSSDGSDIDDDSDGDGDDAAAKMSTSMFNCLKQLTSKLPTSDSSSYRAGASCSRDGHLSRGIGTGCFHDLSVEDLNMSETQWRAELVVLSACRTASGRLTAEGVLSLARAFIVAGVPSVVASLWKVDDFGTIPLMKVFYRRLRRGDDVATALRFAMLICMKKSPEIRLWAPFNVWGDPFLQIPENLQHADYKFEHIDDSDDVEGAQQAINYKDAAGATQDRANKAAGAADDNVTDQAGSSSTFGEGGSGFAAAATVGGGEAHEFGVDPIGDLELAFPLLGSKEEEQAQQDAAMKRSTEVSTAKGQAGKSSSDPDITVRDAPLVREITDKSSASMMIDDDTSLLEQALAMSLADAAGAPIAAGGGTAASDMSMAGSGEDDQDLAYALQMSMQEGSADVNQDSM